jgi:hypothetical protein
VPVEHHAVDWSSVLLLDDFKLREEPRRVQGRVSGVDAIANERLRNTSRNPIAGQPDPQIPVLTETVSPIEALGR